MIQNIAQGYKKLFSTVAKVLVLLAACTALGAAIVYPLWKFATTSPFWYTAVVLALICIALVWLFVRKARANGLQQMAFTLLRIAVVVGGIVACVALVLHGKRFLAIPVVIAAIILYGVLSFGREKK